MIILGIDPGTIRMGYAVIQTSNFKPEKVLSIGIIDISKVSEHPEKLKIIFEKVQKIISEYHPQEMAVEAPFYGKNVQSMLKLGRSQGIAMAVAFAHQLKVTEYSPKKIKLSITGNGNAAKEQVSAVLRKLIDFEYDEKYLDATDALAVAVCHCFQKNNPVTNSNTVSKKIKPKNNSWKNFIEKNPDRKI